MLVRHFICRMSLQLHPETQLLKINFLNDLISACMTQYGKIERV